MNKESTTMKRLLLTAAALAALTASPAPAENVIPQSLDEFNKLYNNGLSLMHTLQRPTRERCTPVGKTRFCTRSMTAVNPADGLTVYVAETQYSDGTQEKETCLSNTNSSDLRRCFISTGEVLDERLEGDTWQTAATIAGPWKDR
jgi:hypothetical protein